MTDQETIAQLKAENARLQSAWNELADLKAELALSYDPDKQKAIQGVRHLSMQLTNAKRENARLVAELNDRRDGIKQMEKNCREAWEAVRLREWEIQENEYRLVRMEQSLKRMTDAVDDCLPMSGDKPIDRQYYAAKLKAIFDAVDYTREFPSAALRDLLKPTMELLKCMDDFVAGSRLCPSRLSINSELSRLEAMTK